MREQNSTWEDRRVRRRLHNFSVWFSGALQLWCLTRRNHSRLISSQSERCGSLKLQMDLTLEKAVSTTCQSETIKKQQMVLRGEQPEAKASQVNAVRSEWEAINRLPTQKRANLQNGKHRAGQATNVRDAERCHSTTDKTDQPRTLPVENVVR